MEFASDGKFVILLGLKADFAIPFMPLQNVKAYIEKSWLKYAVFEESEWEEALNDGQLNEYTDEKGVKTKYWCKDLLDILDQEEVLKEVDKLIQVFFEEASFETST